MLNLPGGNLTLLHASQPILLSGNEATARGAIEAGVSYASGYPGSPVTEIGLALAASQHTGLHFTWSTHEAAAVEKGFAACWIGHRVLLVFKEPGLNVALDSLRAMAEKETLAGLVIILGTDAKPETSQTSQDSRGILADLQVPILEPAGPQECLELTREAFRLSTQYALPVVLRLNVWMAQMRSVVRPGALPPKSSPMTFRLVLDRPMKFVTSIPTYAHDVMARACILADVQVNESPQFCCQSHRKEAPLGLVVSNLLVHRVREAIRESGIPAGLASLQMTWPLPEKLLLKFMQRYAALLVVEEQMPFLETELQALAQRGGVTSAIWGKRQGAFFPLKAGEIGSDDIIRAMQIIQGHRAVSTLSPSEGSLLLHKRLPVFCPGCPHPATHFAINHRYDQHLKCWVKRMDLLRCADTGCYGSLGSYAGLGELKFNMGAGFGCVGGLIDCQSLVDITGKESDTVRLVAFAGDSTFLHSGVTRLVDIAAQQIPCLLVIFDNYCIGMAGKQPTPQLDIQKVCRGLNIHTFKTTTDNLRVLSTRIETALSLVTQKQPVVLIRRAPCVKLNHSGYDHLVAYQVDITRCTKCMLCLTEFLCPALVQFSPDAYPTILPDLCTRCGNCTQVCKYSLDPTHLRMGESAIIRCE